MSTILQLAYNNFMAKAPSSSFPKARALYFDKYPLSPEHKDERLRLFVCSEELEENIKIPEEDNPCNRFITISSRLNQLAIVHWKQIRPPTQEEIKIYLNKTWDIETSNLILKPIKESWFRNGGHQTRFKPRDRIYWEKSYKIPFFTNKNINQ